MKIVLTGGHLSPALSIIDSLPKEDEIIFLGRKYALEGDGALSLEYLTIAKKRIKFISMSTGRLQRKFTSRTILSFLKLPYGFIQALFALVKYKPDLILGFGSYISLPVCFAGFFLKIPIVVHEQTFGAGLANKIISLWAKKICVSWKESEKYFPKEKTVLTGSPMRQFKINNLQLAINEEIPVIFVTGGSLGSHTINLLIENNLEKLLARFIIIHQTGAAQEFGDFERLKKIKFNLSPDFGKRYHVFKFIDPDKMGNFFEKADIVISRAGINTITEIIHFGKPCLLVPLLFSGRGEQMQNALFMQNKKAAEIYIENKQNDFFKLLSKMLNNLEPYKNQAKNLKGIIIKNSAEKIIEVVRYVQKNKKE